MEKAAIPVDKDVPATEADVELKPIAEEPKSKSSFVGIGAVLAILILLGVGTGYLLSRPGSGVSNLVGAKPGYVSNSTVAGVTDTKTFSDSAEGVIQKGGIDGEGTHKLVREGGDSQTAYLVSSVVDLDQYVGKKVKVWGQTMGAQKAAWLMDVGKVEVLQ